MGFAQCLIPAVCCMGFVIMWIGVGIMTGTTGSEVKIWYNVPLCASSGTTYVSRGGTCPPAPPAGSTDPPLAPQEVSFDVKGKFFLPEAKYTTFVYTTDGVAIAPSDPGGTADTYLKVSIAGTSYSTAETSSSSGSSSTARRLLKGSSYSSGSSYSGPSFRSYRGRYYSYYGTSPRQTRYGRSGRGAVGTSIIYVNSPAPIYSTRTTATNTYASGATGSNCQNAETGCEYTIHSSMTKSELAQASFTTPKDVETKSYTLRVEGRIAYSLTTAYPNLMISFATDKTASNWGVGILVVVAGIGTMICCTFGAAVCAARCNRGGSTRYTAFKSSGSATRSTHTGAGVSVNSNPLHSKHYPGYTSKVEVPMPRITGPRHTHVSEDYRSLADVPATMVVVNVRDNDIASCSGSHKSCRSLDVSHNNLTSLWGISNCMPELEAVNFDENDLNGLAGLGNMPDLKWIKAVSNDIRSLRPDGPLASVTYLNLANNDLKDLDGIECYPHLTHLDVASNDVRTLNGIASHCQNLQAINLAENAFTSADDLVTLAKIPTLRYLNIKSNDMRAIEVQRVRDAFEDRTGFVLES